MTCREAGFETIMMNSNPETVSTDYDTSSRLYFEPLTVEDVLNVLERERPEGIIVQFGGQTPLSLAGALQKALTERPIPAASGGCGLLCSEDNCVRLPSGVSGLWVPGQNVAVDLLLVLSKAGWYLCCSTNAT